MNESHDATSFSGEGVTLPSRLQMVGAGALAILLYLLLMDAAVETFLSHSPLRWIIVGTVAGFLALSVLLWRKLSWATKASISFVVLLGLMALAAWWPDGSDSPLTLLRQTTSTLLSGTTILGILLAAWILARLKFLPWPVRLAFIVLAAYGVSAFVSGIVTGTPYTALLHGRSIWSRLPFWLQGGFIGGLVMVPLSLVLVIAGRIHQRSRLTDAARSGFQQAVALGLSFVLSLSTFTSQADFGIARPFPNNTAELTVPAGGDLSAPDPPSTATPDEIAAKAEAWIKRTPKTRYSMVEMADALGPGIEPTFFFVRDKIRYESYPGILRGDEQTFLARAGNSFDRSLLLATLLKRKGVTTRFASGQLSRDDAKKLFARIFETTGPQNAAPATAVPPGAAAFLSRVKARGRRDYMAIRAALGGSLPASSSPSQEDVLREIEQHFWVQAEVGGRWIDIDSSFADATPGRSYCQAQNTLDQPPNEVHQRVTIRVSSETMADNQVKSETVMEVPFAVDDLLDQQIFLFHVPAGQALGGLGGAPQGGSVWAPTLWVDGQFYSGKPIDFSTQESHGGGFGDLLGETSGASTGFVAEWLEFDIAFPDGHHDVTRRILADGGLAWRKAGPPDAGALRPLAQNERGPLPPQALHNIWFSAGRHDLASYAKALMYLTRSLEQPTQVQPSASTQSSPRATPAQAPNRSADHPAPADSTVASQLSFGEQVWPLALQNFAFLVWSDHLIIPLVNDAPSVRLYADSPRILMFSVGLDPKLKGAPYGEYDLRRDFLRGVARESDEPGVIERKIWFGALEGALEHEAAMRDAVSSGSDPATVKSTSDVLTSEGAIALRASNPRPEGALDLDPEIAARIAFALANGSSLVVPRPVPPRGPTGWWEITQAGDTRAVLDADLNGSRYVPRWTKYQGRGLDAGGGGETLEIDSSGNVLQEEDLFTGKLRRNRPGPKEKSRGDEYIMTVTAIVMTILWIAVESTNRTSVEIQSAAALEGVEFADGGTDGGP